MKFLLLPAVALLILFAPGAPAAPAAVKHFPALNPPHTNAWVVPIQGTHGLGQYVARSARWRITVQRGAFAPDTSDDWCGHAQHDSIQVPNRPFGAAFLLAVHNSGRTELDVQESWISLVWDSTERHAATWGGPLALLPGMYLPVEPGQTRVQYVEFSGLPRTDSTYALQIEPHGFQPATIGTYQVIVNSRNPCA